MFIDNHDIIIINQFLLCKINLAFSAYSFIIILVGTLLQGVHITIGVHYYKGHITIRGTLL